VKLSRKAQQTAKKSAAKKEPQQEMPQGSRFQRELATLQKLLRKG
jgi:hypothetical protein